MALSIEEQLAKMMALVEAQAAAQAALTAKLEASEKAREAAERAAQEERERKGRGKARQGEATQWGNPVLKLVKYAPRSKGDAPNYGLVIGFTKVYSSDGQIAPNPVSGAPMQLNSGKGIYLDWCQACLDLPEDLQKIVRDKAAQESLVNDPDMREAADKEFAARQEFFASKGRYKGADADDDVSEAQRMTERYRRR